MNILFLARSLAAGGAERQMVALAYGLHKRGHTVAVATFYGNGRLSDDLRSAGVAYYIVGKRDRWDLVWFLRRLVGTVRGVRPDIVYSFLTIPNLVAVSIKPFLRSSRIVWSLRHARLEVGTYDRATRWAYRMQPCVAGRADLIIANSYAGRLDAVATGFPEDRLVVVPNGFDTTTFSPQPEAGRCMRSRWGIAEDSILIGLPARLDPVKGHEVFLCAAAAISRTRKNTCFVCVGSGPESLGRALRERAENLGLRHRLTWAGEIVDMPAAYSALDIACLTSHSEGSPNVVAEAMACGVRCVVTNVGDAAQLVGDTGSIVPPGDPDAFARAASDLLAKAGSTQMPDPRARIVAEYSIERATVRTEEQLERLLCRGLSSAA